jgi:hypothetical protein
MFEQFRQQYPQGCISSDLVQIHDNQYVVRVAIQSEGIPLAAALAVNVDLVIAETQATRRALAIIGIREESSLLTTNSPVVAAITPQPMDSLSPEDILTEPAETLPILPLPKPRDLPLGVAEQPPLEFYEQSDNSVPEPNEEFSFITADVTEEITSGLATPEEELIMSVKGGGSKKSNSSLAPIHESVAPASSDDSPLTVTDIIPLINMELKRLGWSKDRGRDYMVTLYNKRASALLSDEELFGLLQHLQAEPLE